MSQQLVLDNALEDSKHFARIMYLAHALTFFFSFGALSFIPLIVNYVKRPETAGTMVHSHHTWISARSGLCLVDAGWLDARGDNCWPFGSVDRIWRRLVVEAYRLIKGFVDLNNNRAMPVQ